LRQRTISRSGHALFRASFQVTLCAGVSAEACHDDAVEGGVGLAVAPAVQPSSPGLSGGLLDGAGAAQTSEGCLVGQPLRGVASGDQQGSGAVGPDADDVQEPWMMGAGRLG
jgi:hypothetical protein